MSILGEQAEEIFKVLVGGVGHLRRTVGDKLQMKYTPELHFRLDHRTERAASISELIREARSTDPNPGALEEPESDPIDPGPSQTDS